MSSDSTAQKPKTAKGAKVPVKASAQTAREREIADYASKGAETYTDRRLLDITESVQRIQFWVALMASLSLVFMVIGVVTLLAASS